MFYIIEIKTAYIVYVETLTSYLHYYHIYLFNLFTTKRSDMVITHRSHLYRMLQYYYFYIFVESLNFVNRIKFRSLNPKTRVTYTYTYNLTRLFVFLS